jgi:hypothetical protein
LKDKKAMANAPVPEICKECYRWGQWKGKCSYFWKDKKECGSKVNDYNDMISLDQLRRR